MSDTTCQHNSYWKTNFGNCMACRAEKAEAKLNIAREALEDVAMHRSEDRDGNYVCWLGETSFLLVQKALDKIK